MRRVSITVAPEDLEEVYDVLLPLLPQGVHEREAQGGRRELSWFGDQLPDVAGALGIRATEWTEQEAPEDRAGRQARFGQVWNVAGRLVVRSPDDPPAPEGAAEIVIESVHGEFGTGAHPTTRHSLELLLEVAPEGAFADLGCGSGVLAIAAGRLGHGPLIAVDYEPASVEATLANAARNGVRLEAFEADLTRVPPPPARTLGANVPLAVHRVVATALDDRTRSVIASGITTEEAEEAVAAYAGGGLQVRRRIDDQGWTALLLERSP